MLILENIHFLVFDEDDLFVLELVGDDAAHVDAGFGGELLFGGVGDDFLLVGLHDGVDVAVGVAHCDETHAGLEVVGCCAEDEVTF